MERAPALRMPPRTPSPNDALLDLVGAVVDVLVRFVCAPPGSAARPSGPARGERLVLDQEVGDGDAPVRSVEADDAPAARPDLRVGELEHAG